MKLCDPRIEAVLATAPPMPNRRRKIVCATLGLHHWLHLRPPHLVILAVLAVLVVSAQAVLAQGTKADYARAESLAGRTEQKLFRTSLKPNWLAGTNQFWYRVQTEADKFEFVLVDADTGEIKRAADAKSLGLPQQESVVPLQQPRTPGRPLRRTGESTAISFNNQLADAVELFWIDAEGQRQPYGRVRPGDTREQHTYSATLAIERWLVSKGRLQTCTSPGASSSLGISSLTSEPIMPGVLAPPTPQRQASPISNGAWRSSECQGRLGREVNPSCGVV